MTKTDRALEAFERGEELTAKQMRSRFGAGNPGAIVQSLRFRGYPIYSNTRKNSKGVVKNFYRLGTPRRAVIAAGYRALAAEASAS